MTVIDNLFLDYYDKLERQGKGGDAFLLYSIWLVECLRELIERHSFISLEYLEMYDAAKQWLDGSLQYDQLEQCFYNLTVSDEPVEDAIATSLFALLGEGDGIGHVDGEAKIAFLLASDEETQIEIRMNHYALLMEIADQYFTNNTKK
jgi:hypothetical protein